MTQNKQFKAEVRRYAEQHGLAYADARRRVLAEREAADGTSETKTVVPSDYHDGLPADLEAKDERSEREPRRRPPAGDMVHKTGSAQDGDLIKVRLSEGKYFLSGVSAPDLERLRPTLDAMNAPSRERTRE